MAFVDLTPDETSISLQPDASVLELGGVADIDGRMFDIVGGGPSSHNVLHRLDKTPTAVLLLAADLPCSIGFSNADGDSVDIDRSNPNCQVRILIF